LSSAGRARLALARSALGFLAGALVWAGLAHPYGVLLAEPAERLIRLFEAPSATWLKASGDEIVVDRPDFPTGSTRPGLPAHDLDFNIAILAALFAAARRPLSDRNVKRFLAAAAILFVTHVLALIFKVEAFYALEMGDWSRAHSGSFARNFWGIGSHFYRIVGIYAVPIALWGILSPERKPLLEFAASAGDSRAPRKRSE
jgi:hypothetical protein